MGVPEFFNSGTAIRFLGEVARAPRDSVRRSQYDIPRNNGTASPEISQNDEKEGSGARRLWGAVGVAHPRHSARRGRTGDGARVDGVPLCLRGVVPGAPGDAEAHTFGGAVWGSAGGGAHRGGGGLRGGAWPCRGGEGGGGGGGAPAQGTRGEKRFGVGRAEGGGSAQRGHSTR